jgi:growth hormone-inducible transmembrane protein
MIDYFNKLGGMIVPKTTKLGLNLYRFSIYGGFLLFGCFVFYDTHRIIIKAEQSTDQYDPLNESLSIYLNTLNILMRIAILIGTKS